VASTFASPSPAPRSPGISAVRARLGQCHRGRQRAFRVQHIGALVGEALRMGRIVRRFVKRIPGRAGRPVNPATVPAARRRCLPDWVRPRMPSKTDRVEVAWAVRAAAVDRCLGDGAVALNTVRRTRRRSPTLVTAVGRRNSSARQARRRPRRSRQRSPRSQPPLVGRSALYVPRAYPQVICPKVERLYYLTVSETHEGGG